MSEENLDDLPLSARLEGMHRRAAEELTANVIADPRRVLSEQAAQRAAFEATACVKLAEVQGPRASRRLTAGAEPADTAPAAW